MELQLYSMKSLQGPYSDVHIHDIKFRHLTWQAKLAVLVVGRALFWQGTIYTAINSPLHMLAYRILPGYFIRGLAKTGLI